MLRPLYTRARVRWYESTVERDRSAVSAEGSERPCPLVLCHKQWITVEGKLGKCVVLVDDGGSWPVLDLGELVGMVAS